MVSILKELKIADLQNFKVVDSMVVDNLVDLEKIAHFIGIPQDANYKDSLAKIIQYLALNHKYHSRNYRFGVLIENLKKWQDYYETIIEVRDEYPRYSYQLPEEFIKPIPAEEIYGKYQDYLLMISSIKDNI